MSVLATAKMTSKRLQDFIVPKFSRATLQCTSITEYMYPDSNPDAWWMGK